jgi:hypothetical protein
MEQKKADGLIDADRPRQFPTWFIDFNSGLQIGDVPEFKPKLPVEPPQLSEKI